MDARNDLFVYIGSTLATIVGLFAVQLWYESYLDVAVVHAQDDGVAIDAKLATVRAEEQQKLGSARVSIEQAMSLYAQRGRSASPKLAVKPSEDLSAMSGWIHQPHFAPYVPRKPAAPPAPAEVAPGAEGVPAGDAAPGEAVPAAADGAEHGAAPAQPGTAPAQPGAAPAAAPAAPAAEPAKPAVREVGTRLPAGAPARRQPARLAPAAGTAP